MKFCRMKLTYALKFIEQIRRFLLFKLCVAAMIINTVVSSSNNVQVE